MAFKPGDDSGSRPLYQSPANLSLREATEAFRFCQGGLSKVCFCIGGCLSIFVTSLLGQESPPVSELEFFEKRIRPVLVERCYECHSVESGKAKGGLRVDSREALRRGGETRPSVVPGELEGSLILEAIRYGNQDLKMPPKGRLTEGVVADFEKWIKMGAPDPRAEMVAGAVVGRGQAGEVTTNHWAFEPPKSVTPPEVKKTKWVQSPVDQFILARLKTVKLRPAAPADKTSLLRRVTFDLIGLPPTPTEVDDFLADRSTNAFAKVVERLLASPHYGERWGRHWLDVARYADSNGQDENKVMSHAWRYRDWVINAFNHDKPFDQFIREQLAGDLLPAGSSERETFDQWTATGFLVLGPKMLAEQDKPKLVMDVVDEQIDVVSRAFLGLTVSCSRCHDHKFDPIPARDYYAMAGIFKSTKTMGDLAFVSKWNERLIATAAEKGPFDAWVKRTNELGRAVTATTNDPVRLEQLKAELASLKTNAPPAPPIALAVEEAAPVDLPVHIRGSHLNLAKDTVPRGFVPVLNRFTPPAVPKKQSGRLQLAEWLTHPGHPLTSRVIVNRIWQAQFGEGLVRTPDNFGLRGEAPTHPELLDWLAREFVRGGWSVKQLHRLILNSSTYQMSTAYSEKSASIDPENRLLWRMNRRRLEAEWLRDGLLAVSGQLDRTIGGSLVNWPNAEYTPGDNVSATSRRRAVYLPVVRDRVYDLFTIFDFANPSVGVSKRTPTVVSHQALFFMNSPLVKEQSKQLARSLEGADESAKVYDLYRRVLSRPPARSEQKRALAYLTAARARLSEKSAERDLEAWSSLVQALFASNEFLYLD